MHCLLDTNEEKRDGLIREVQQGADNIWLEVREYWRIPNRKAIGNSQYCNCSKTDHLLLFYGPSTHCNTPFASLSESPLPFRTFPFQQTKQINSHQRAVDRKTEDR